MKRYRDFDDSYDSGPEDVLQRESECEFSDEYADTDRQFEIDNDALDHDSAYNDHIAASTDQYDKAWITKQNKSGTSTIAAARMQSMFFGAPLEGSNRDTAYSSIPRVRWSARDLPSHQKCLYLTELQDYQFKRALDWPVTDILPLMLVSPDTIVVMGSWDTPDTLLGRTPEETASVVVKSQYTSRETSLTRYGAGMELRLGFMETPEGRQSYLMSINGISRSLGATSNCMVLNALMRTKVERFEHGPFPYRRWSPNITLGEFRIQTKESFNAWARIQKSNFGYSGIVAESRDSLANGPGVALNYMIAPRGADVYVRGSTAENNMFISGRPAGHRRDITMRSDLDVPTTRIGMSFKSDPEEPVYDPQFENVEIGGFARMEYRTPPLYQEAHINMDPTRRDVLIFNENRDDWERIRFDFQLFNNSRLFAMNEGKYTWYNTFNQDDNTHQVNSEKDQHQPTFGRSHNSIPAWLCCVGGTRAVAQFGAELCFMRDKAPGILAEFHAKLNFQASRHAMARPEDIVAHQKAAAKLRTCPDWLNNTTLREKVDAKCVETTQALLQSCVNLLVAQSELSSNVQNVQNDESHDEGSDGESDGEHEQQSQASQASRASRAAEAAEAAEEEARAQEGLLTEEEKANSKQADKKEISRAMLGLTVGYHAHPRILQLLADSEMCDACKNGNIEDCHPRCYWQFFIAQCVVTRYVNTDVKDLKVIFATLINMIISDAPGRLPNVSDIIQIILALVSFKASPDANNWHTRQWVEWSTPEPECLKTPCGVQQDPDKTTVMSSWSFGNELNRDPSSGDNAIPLAVSLMIEYGFSVPISLILARPHQTYHMGTVIALAVTPDLGHLMQGGSNFLVQDDAIRKLHVGHYTTHLGVAIERPQNVILTENALCGRHISGGGVQVPGPDVAFRRWTENTHGAGHDMMVLPVPGSTSNIEDVCDLTGSFPACITDTNFNDFSCVRNQCDEDRLTHYRSSEYCAEVWGIERNGSQSREIDPQTVQLGTNTIMFQQAQYVWSADGTFGTRIKGRGYWQDQVYAGAAAERSGRKPAILRGRGEQSHK
jgi:hypothetical protein